MCSKDEPNSFDKMVDLVRLILGSLQCAIPYRKLEVEEAAETFVASVGDDSLGGNVVAKVGFKSVAALMRIKKAQTRKKRNPSLGEVDSIRSSMENRSFLFSL